MSSTPGRAKLLWKSFLRVLILITSEFFCLLSFQSFLKLLDFPLTPKWDLKFQHFLLRQIKCRGNYMKIHFASAFPWQCFCQGWQDFILSASVFTWATSAKTLTRSKLVKLPPLLHISPRIMCSIMCTMIVVQILLCKYCYMQCNVLFSHVKNCFKNNFGCFIWVQK